VRAQEHYQAGDLQEAVKAATEDVKEHPNDFARRMLLAELLCISGDLERADKHFDALGHQDPQSIPAVQVLRQLIRAEQARLDFYNSGAVPEFLGLPTPVARLLLQASIELREGNKDEATKLLAQAEEQRPRVTGSCDGKEFEDIRDLDDLNGPIVEVYTSAGKYYWVPFENIESIEFRPRTRPRDLLWRRAHLIVRDGPDGEVYLPALYAGSHKDSDDRVRLGRVTDWKGSEGEPVRGIGQRTWLVGDEARPILEIETIEIDAPAGGSAPAVGEAQQGAGEAPVAG
jgi:type VI secretion system protein ImpE